MAEALSDTATPEPFAVEAAKPSARLSPLRSVYVTAMLAIITMLSIADKSVLSVLLVPIKKDLHVSDAAMGALTGISFTLVYATVALPMARLADTGIRRNIVASAVAVWSIMTAVCGLASNYATLLVARMGVAAGEASAAPSSTSMVSDLFSFRRRGTALGFITLGSALGTALGAVVAGQITARYNWHVAFMVLGAPGLVIALLFLLTAPEPARGGHDGGERHSLAFASWWRTILYLTKIPSFWPLILANTFIVLSFTAFTAWMPTYLMRVMGLSMGHMSALWGVVSSPAIVGVVLGGFLSDRMASRGARWRVYFMAFLLLLGVPVFGALLATKDIKVVIAMMLIYAFVIGPVASIVIAANLDVVRPRARGMMTGIVGIFSAFLGAGLGPVLIGRANDMVNHTYGDQSLRHTLIAVPIFLVVASLALLWASLNTDRDAKAARSSGPVEEPVAG